MYDYYPYGMLVPNRNYQSPEYRYGFNSAEKDNEIKGEGNSLDFGNRIYDPRTGRWLSVDPLQASYPFASPYNFALNTPIQAYDPDGRLVLFVNGLRGAPNPFKGKDYSWTGYRGIYGRGGNSTLEGYWSGTNTFGRNVDMAQRFMDRIGDQNAYFTSGSSDWDSQAKANWFERNVLGVRSRYHEGVNKANKFHKMVEKGKIELADDETIKIVTHSQGGAHGNGMADRLIELGYDVEVIYNVTPHQPTDITSPDNVRGVQYSHPSDAVSSKKNWLNPWFNGGSEFGKIIGIDEFDGRDIMGPGTLNPDVTPGGPNGNRGGHNVMDNDFIFDIKKGDKGYVAPRKDK